jgi:K+-transporting ATPase ATPase C chain
MSVLKLFLLLTILTGGLYPVLVTLVGQGLFSEKAQGSQILENGKLIGAMTVAQKFTKDEFFHPRPSSSDYATVPSGATQFSWTQAKLRDQYESLKAKNPEADSDLWTTSGSGLDPDISLKSARSQVERISKSRGVAATEILNLIETYKEDPTLGIWGQPRVNVLRLNLALSKVGNGQPRSAP